MVNSVTLVLIEMGLSVVPMVLGAEASFLCRSTALLYLNGIRGAFTIVNAPLVHVVSISSKRGRRTFPFQRRDAHFMVVGILVSCEVGAAPLVALT